VACRVSSLTCPVSTELVSLEVFQPSPSATMVDHLKLFVYIIGSDTSFLITNSLRLFDGIESSRAVGGSKEVILKMTWVC
jgi:hypothetical protein